jgi:hypothetical protein
MGAGMVRRGAASEGDKLDDLALMEELRTPRVL